jgi:16S rRNA pseudouridine516 synthase
MPRLDRFLARTLAIKRGDARLLLAKGRVEVDGAPATGIAQVVGRFSEVRLDDRILQGRTARYLMLNKPSGVVSATRDDIHRTVIDLLDAPWKDELHIAGRLDITSTGLMLLTNDGHWSRSLSLPGSRLPKRYRVTVEQPLAQEHVEAFRNGFHFAYEDIRTRPAGLSILGEFEAEVSLMEGRYHQIRRMFGHLGVRVLHIHRFAVGALMLDAGLEPGQSRALTPAEVDGLATAA